MRTVAEPIANVLGAQADLIFAMDPNDLGAGTAWIGVIAYAFQIYFDFAGYSDMAIGLGLMIGFKFPENFNNPYISQSISEFWRRWHMTLGRFMRDYLYIPMGGNRVTPLRLYFNLWIVFLLSGLWHGAAWNFVIWGAFHGTFLIADRLFLLKFLERIGKIPSILVTFFITLVGWVLFRADNLQQALDYLKSMFSFARAGEAVELDRQFWIILSLAVIFSFMAVIKGNESWQIRVLGNWGISARGKGETWRRGGLGTLKHGGMEAWKQGSVEIWKFCFAVFFFLLSLASVLSSGFNPFIYFRF